jgi:hypothetical protein
MNFTHYRKDAKSAKNKKISTLCELRVFAVQFFAFFATNQLLMDISVQALQPHDEYNR